MYQEQTPEEEHQPQPGRFRTTMSKIAGHLATQDLNLSEGRLRSSVMPVEHMQIPDHPPLHDDTIPAPPEAEDN
jgi:hypothetical protein